MKLKTKFVLMPIIIILPVLSVLGVFSYTVTEHLIENELDEKSQIALAMTDAVICKYFDTITDATNLLATYTLFQTIDDKLTSYVDLEDSSGKIPMKPRNNYETEVLKICKDFADSIDDAFTVAVGAEKNGGFIMYPPAPRKNGYDARQRGWYKAAMASPHIQVFSAPRRKKKE